MSNVFNEKPIIAYNRNKNLRELIGQVHLSNDKLSKSGRCNITKGYYKPCLTKLTNLCCKQIIRTVTFTNESTGQSFNIHHELNCRSR